MTKTKTLLHQCGRTLLELCVTFGFLGLLLGISAPQFSATKRALAIKRAALALQELASQLPTLAQQQGVTLTLREAARGRLILSNSQTAVTLREIILPRSLNIIFSLPGDKVSAYPSGVVSPGKLIISDQHSRCTITISLWGRVRSACA